ncbi:palmitoyltransferase [Saccharomycopsis crataegensis]|uniref:Palmitoyltransferase n=1 Tax=Saccharomycopsis crataegensis TaxID=43959 RepID=A0AAV5QS36_9ASCO|nr:palmitoyltransferase [Saccharomycopsis crataegensis]
MKIYYIGIFKPLGTEKAIELTSVSDLSSFGYFERSSVGSFMKFFAETVVARTSAGQRQSVQQNKYMGHVYMRSEGVGAVILTDQEYQIRPAYGLLNKVLDEFISTYPPSQWSSITTAPNTSTFKMPSLDTYIKKYQDPSQADAIMRVQKELDETKIVLNKTIENVLKRGENLDSMVQKSETLGISSKIFYEQAKKTNSCCIIM